MKTLLPLAFLCFTFTSFTQSSFYLKIINYAENELIHDVELTSNEKKCSFTEISKGIWKVDNLKPKKSILIRLKNPKDYTSETREYFRPKKIQASDTVNIFFEKSDGYYKRIWALEDLKYPFKDTSGIVRNPDFDPELIDSVNYMKEINKNIHFPEKSIEKNEQGRVIIIGMVDLDGSLCNFEIIQGVSLHIDRAAIRTVRKANFKPLKPALKDGKPVKSYFIIPLNFVLH